MFCFCSFHINEILCSLFNWVVVLCLDFFRSRFLYACVQCVWVVMNVDYNDDDDDAAADDDDDLTAHQN